MFSGVSHERNNFSFPVCFWKYARNGGELETGRGWKLAGGKLWGAKLLSQIIHAFSHLYKSNPHLTFTPFHFPIRPEF